MKHSAQALQDILQEWLPYLQGLTEEQASHSSAPEVWSPKQLLGHLIDSSVNNYARFVRAASQDGLSLPGYDQNVWVRLGGWRDRPWAEILALWQAYQTQVAYLIERLPPQSLRHELRVGGGESVTLRFLTEDYVAHQLHHLAQIRERVQ